MGRRLRVEVVAEAVMLRVGHHGLDVAAGDQHELAAAGDHLGGLVAALPRRDVVGAPGTTYVSQAMRDRSIGVPRTVRAPGWVSWLPATMSSIWWWKAELSLVWSAFQARMSKAGGSWPSR